MKTFRIFYGIGFTIFLIGGLVWGFGDIWPWGVWAAACVLAAEIITPIVIKKRLRDQNHED